MESYCTRCHGLGHVVGECDVELSEDRRRRLNREAQARWRRNNRGKHNEYQKRWAKGRREEEPGPG